MCVPRAGAIAAGSPSLQSGRTSCSKPAAFRKQARLQRTPNVKRVVRKEGATATDAYLTLCVLAALHRLDALRLCLLDVRHDLAVILEVALFEFLKESQPVRTHAVSAQCTVGLAWVRPRHDTDHCPGLVAAEAIAQRPHNLVHDRLALQDTSRMNTGRG